MLVPTAGPGTAAGALLSPRAVGHRVASESRRSRSAPSTANPRHPMVEPVRPTRSGSRKTTTGEPRREAPNRPHGAEPGQTAASPGPIAFGAVRRDALRNRDGLHPFQPAVLRSDGAAGLGARRVLLPGDPLWICVANWLDQRVPGLPSTGRTEERRRLRRRRGTGRLWDRQRARRCAGPAVLATSNGHQPAIRNRGSSAARECDRGVFMRAPSQCATVSAARLARGQRGAEGRALRGRARRSSSRSYVPPACCPMCERPPPSKFRATPV